MYKRNNQGWLKHLDFILWDVLSLQIAFILAFSIRYHGFRLPYGAEIYRIMGIMYGVIDVLMAAVFNTMHNVVKRGYYQEFVQTLKQTLLVFVSMTLFMFSVKSSSSYSRIIVYTTAIFHFFIGYFIRIWWKKMVRRIGRTKAKSTMILVADEETVETIVSKTSDLDGFVISGLVLTNRNAAGEEICGLKVVADLSDAADYICRQWVDEVFIYPQHLSDLQVGQSEFYANVQEFMNDAYSVFTKKEYNAEAEDIEEGTVSALIEQCRLMSVPVHIRLPISNIGGKSFMEKMGGYNVLTMTSNYASGLQLAMKRALDIAGGLVGSILALIVMAIVAPMIKKESPGPILFKQTRIGKNGKQFQFYKIRSMYMDAEERKQELMEQNRVGDGMMFKLDWDPRIIGNKIVDGKQVTGIGEFIRSHSLDEFPQFFNVLMNQMSLVGTRPPTVDEWGKYKYHHRARLAFKPGITGLWQVSGRSRITDFEEVVKLDMEYINNWSFALDIRILIKTIKGIFSKDGAM